MAAKHHAPRKRKQVSRPRGPRGKAGPPGPAGPNHTSDIAALAAEVAYVVKELHVQLTRISQIQVQLDRLASGQPPAPADDDLDRRTSN